MVPYTTLTLTPAFSHTWRSTRRCGVRVSQHDTSATQPRGASLYAPCRPAARVRCHRRHRGGSTRPGGSGSRPQPPQRRISRPASAGSCAQTWPAWRCPGCRCAATRRAPGPCTAGHHKGRVSATLQGAQASSPTAGAATRAGCAVAPGCVMCDHRVARTPSRGSSCRWAGGDAVAKPARPGHTYLLLDGPLRRRNSRGQDRATGGGCQLRAVHRAGESAHRPLRGHRLTPTPLCHAPCCGSSSAPQRCCQTRRRCTG